MNPVFTMSTLLGAAALLTDASTSHSAVLADFKFDGGSAASSDADAGSTAGNFTTSNTAAGNTSSSGNAFLRSVFTGSTAADAASDTDFFTFTIAGNGGQLLNLSSLVLDLGASVNTTTGGTVPFDNTVFVSSGATQIGTANSTTVSNTNGTPGFPTTAASFDLSGAEFQGLSTITFKFAFADSADQDAAINRLDNVVLNGTTALAVPEPSMLALAPLTLATMMRRRR
jgi:hypothetical protein